MTPRQSTPGSSERFVTTGSFGMFAAGGSTLEINDTTITVGRLFCSPVVTTLQPGDELVVDNTKLEDNATYEDRVRFSAWGRRSFDCSSGDELWAWLDAHGWTVVGAQYVGGFTATYPGPPQVPR